MFTTARIVATNVAEAGSPGKFDETDFACLEWSVMGRVHSYFAGKLGDIELEMMLELGLMKIEHGRGEMDASCVTFCPLPIGHVLRKPQFQPLSLDTRANHR